MRCGVLVVCLFACGGATTTDAPGSPAPPAGGGEKVCTDIGCVEGLAIDLFGSWASGSYVFTMVADGATNTCKGSIPLPPCDSGSGVQCTSKLSSVAEAGCARELSQQGFPGVRFRASPVSASLRIERDGAVLADQVFSPHYREFPRDCEATCRQASESLTLAGP